MNKETNEKLKTAKSISFRLEAASHIADGIRNKIIAELRKILLYLSLLTLIDLIIGSIE
jgi:hypothetical protein